MSVPKAKSSLTIYEHPNSLSHTDVFRKCFHRIHWIQWSKKIIENWKDCPISTRYLLCKKQRWYDCVKNIQVTGESLNWTQFFLRFSEFAKFTEFNESSVLF